MPHVITEDYVLESKRIADLVPGDVIIPWRDFTQEVLESHPEEDGNGHFLKVRERIWPHTIAEWRHVPSEGTYTVSPTVPVILEMDGERIMKQEMHRVLDIYFTGQGWYQGRVVDVSGQEFSARFHKASRTWYAASVSYPPAERQVDVLIGCYGSLPNPDGGFIYIEKDDALAKFSLLIGHPLSQAGDFPGNDPSWVIEEVYEREQGMQILAKIAPPVVS